MRNLVKTNFRRLVPKILTRRGERGVSLLETLLGLGLLGVIGIGFLTSLATSSSTTRTLDVRVDAEAMVRSQLEDIRSRPYASSYSVTVVPPPGFTLSIVTQQLDGGNNLQQVTAKVAQGASTVMRLNTYKARR